MQRSEDLQLVHYDSGATFGMHHDSSKFLPRFLTAFYYLNEPDAGGETAFPAAGGAMSPAEAMALREPAAEGAGLVVKPLRGAALLWYNHNADGEIDAYAVHAGCRVQAGEKWGANHWVRLADAPAGQQQQQQQKEQKTVASQQQQGGGDACAADDGGEGGDEGASKSDAARSKNAKKREKKKAKAAAARADEPGEPAEVS